jgi:hypothetical protein
MFLAEQQAMHAPLPLLLSLRWTQGPLVPLSADQTSDSQKGWDRDFMEDGYYIKIEFPEGLNSVSSSIWMGTIMQQHNTFHSSLRRLLRIAGFSLSVSISL